MAYELGFIGAGNMAEAIARGVIGAGVFQPSQVLAADPSAERLDLFRNELGIRTTDDNAAVAERCRIVLLCVKPQQMADVLQQIRPAANPQALFISIAAGISSRFFEEALDASRQPRVIRVMPNTPMLVGAGMVAAAAGRWATADDLAAARQIFQSAADVMELDESLMDAVTAVSGSGPAYFFFLVEQMIQAGVKLGLSADQARQLASQTALGAARMLTSSRDTPDELRRKVTSPGGTTQAAITHLQENHWPQITVEAILAAAKRSAELGK